MITRIPSSKRLLVVVGAVFFCFSDLVDCQTSEQQLQCYACGLPKVHPENDIAGSYGDAPGKRLYNESCQLMRSKMVDGEVDSAFLRTCPAGVKSCFIASGSYDHNDNDPSNDLEVLFLGCSEAKYAHEYGCDREFQAVNIRDRSNAMKQVDINVKLCFCSEHTCNHPDGELLTGGVSRIAAAASNLVVVLGVVVAWIRFY